jgi:hypothetical protein
MENFFGIVLTHLIFYRWPGHQFGTGVDQLQGDRIFADGDGFFKEGQSIPRVFQCKAKVVLFIGDADAFDAGMSDRLAVEPFL